MIGLKSGRLTVKRLHSKGHSTKWECACECGNITTATTSQIKGLSKKSCGCYRKELTKTLRARSGGNTLPNGVSHFNKIYYQYKHDAEKRGLEFDLTKLELKNIISQNCHYCDAMPESGFLEKTRNGNFLHNGIDRVDNFIGYNAWNSVASCWTCNRMKSSMDYDTFIDRCTAVYLTRGKHE